MRIVTAKEFLEMKPPVLFQKYNCLCDWGSLCLKYENASFGINDFYYVDFMSSEIIVNGKEPQDTCECLNMLEELEKTHGDFERDYECGGRDGFFDMEQLYVVYGKNDIKQLIKALQAVIDNEN